MFAAVGCLVTMATRRAPMALILDDVHWAPKPTLLLLRHLLGALEGVPIMVIASYRDNEVDRDHPLADAFAGLRDGPAVTNIALQGLDAAGVTAYLEAAAGHRLDQPELDLARVLYNETEGNPFFLGQLLRHLVESGAIARQEDRWVWQAAIEDLTVPDGVREVVRRRLSRLSDATNRTLTVAAVIGREFSLDILEHIEGLGDRLALLDAIDPAVQARLVMEVGPVAGSYNFSHALVRHTLYGELTTGRRAWMHQKVGEALEKSPARSRPSSPPWPITSVRRRPRATRPRRPTTPIRRAVRPSTAWRSNKPSRCCSGVSKSWRSTTLPTSSVVPICSSLWPKDGSRRRSGKGGGPSPCSLPMMPEPSVRRCASPGWLPRAATRRRSLSMNPEFDVMAEEALAGLGNDHPGLRAQLLNGLALHRQWFHADADGAAQLARQAIDLARQAGDDRALAEALSVVATHRTTTGSEQAAYQVPWPTSRRPRRPHRRRAARMLALEAGASSRLELGDIAGFEADTAELVQLSNELRSPLDQSFATMWRAVRALLDGNFAEVETIAGQLYPYARGNGAWSKAHAILVLHVLREQGRLAESGPLLPLAMEDSQVAGIHAAPLLVHLGLGDDDAVARDLDELAAEASPVSPSPGPGR